MGCDWIGNGGSFIGYEISYDSVFGSTKYDDANKYDSDEDCYTSESAGILLGEEFSEFLQESYPELKLNHSLDFHVGFAMHSGTYESEGQDCTIIWGYSLSDTKIQISSAKKNEAMNQMSLNFEFPVNGFEILSEFMSNFTSKLDGARVKAICIPKSFGIFGHVSKC